MKKKIIIQTGVHSINFASSMDAIGRAAIEIDQENLNLSYAEVLFEFTIPRLVIMYCSVVSPSRCSD